MSGMCKAFARLCKVCGMCKACGMCKVCGMCRVYGKCKACGVVPWVKNCLYEVYNAQKREASNQKQEGRVPGMG